MFSSYYKIIFSGFVLRESLEFGLKVSVGKKVYAGTNKQIIPGKIYRPSRSGSIVIDVSDLDKDKHVSRKGYGSPVPCQNGDPVILLRFTVQSPQRSYDT